MPPLPGTPLLRKSIAVKDAVYAAQTNFDSTLLHKVVDNLPAATCFLPLLNNRSLDCAIKRPRTHVRTGTHGGNALPPIALCALHPLADRSGRNADIAGSLPHRPPLPYN